MDKGEATKQARNIVLVGRAGNGKSATGNSLIGQKVFESDETHAKCQAHEDVTGDNHTINVINTPGLSDLGESAKFISREIVRCLTLAEGGIHAVVWVLSAKTQIEEMSTLGILYALFGSEIAAYVIIVFTGGDVLEEEGVTLDEFLGREDCPPFVKDVLKMFGNRKVLFDNKTHDEGKKAEQVNKILSLVDEIKRKNNGQSITDGIYKEIKERTDKLSKELEELKAKNHPADLESELKIKLHAETVTLMSNEVEKKLKAAKEELKAAVQQAHEEDVMVTCSVNYLPGQRIRKTWIDRLFPDWWLGSWQEKAFFDASQAILDLSLQKCRTGSFI